LIDTGHPVFDKHIERVLAGHDRRAHARQPGRSLRVGAVAVKGQIDAHRTIARLDKPFDRIHIGRFFDRFFPWPAQIDEQSRVSRRRSRPGSASKQGSVRPFTEMSNSE